jgi:NAD(P)H-dependent FMN reductase
MNIVILSGSPRKVSITKRVAIYLREILRDKHHVELIRLDESALPPVQHVFAKEEQTPEEYKELRAKMLAADAFIFVSPEYNGGYSSAMKNLIDHFPKITYMRKAIGIVAASDGLFGGMRAALQMQLLVCALFGVPCPQMLITPQVDKKFDEQGKLVDEAFQRNIDNFLAEYLWLAESLAQNR